MIGTDAATDRILPSLKSAAQQLILGRTDGQNIADSGPVVSKEHRKRIEGYIQKGNAAVVYTNNGRSVREIQDKAGTETDFIIIRYRANDSFKTLILLIYV